MVSGRTSHQKFSVNFMFRTEAADSDIFVSLRVVVGLCSRIRILRFYSLYHYPFTTFANGIGKKNEAHSCPPHLRYPRKYSEVKLRGFEDTDDCDRPSSEDAEIKRAWNIRLTPAFFDQSSLPLQLCNKPLCFIFRLTSIFLRRFSNSLLYASRHLVG
jgi:hypothetical protein